MGYVFNFQDVKAYEDWCRRPVNQAAIVRETRLMMEMLQPMRGRSVLDIGCGTGTGLAVFLEQGLSPTGIDASPYMLDAAKATLGNRADLHRGSAESLPFDDNSFNYACLVKTLEFVDTPQMAIAEACRVAKDRVYIGVMNRFAIKYMQRRIAGIFQESLFNRAHFFSIWELKDAIRELLGDVPVTWRTLGEFPISSGKIARCIGQSDLFKRWPFGEYTGMVVVPIPQFKTRPMVLPCTANPRTGGVIG